MSKIVRFPASKSRRQRKRLEEDELDALIRSGQRKNLFRFLGVLAITGILLGATLTLVLLTTPTIKAVLGVE